MRRITVVSLMLLFTATLLLAHAGEVHTYLGTVTKINADGSFVIRMTNGNERTVLVSKSTTYNHADGHAGKRSEITVGRRVAAKISKDAKTALNVKLSATRK